MVDEVSRTLESSISGEEGGSDYLWRSIVRISTSENQFAITQNSVRFAEDSSDMADANVESIELEFESPAPLMEIRSLVDQHAKSPNMSHSLVVTPSSVSVMSDKDGGLETRELDDVDATVSLTKRVLEIALEENSAFEEPVFPAIPLGKRMTNMGTKDTENLSTLQDTFLEALESRDDRFTMRVADDDLLSRCLPRFNDGDYAGAAREAGQILEERVAALSSINDAHGTDLFNQALSPDDGAVLVSDEPSEQLGVMLLFRGFYQAVRNPLSHRRPDPTEGRFLDNLGKQETYQILCLADFLLGLLEYRE